MYTSAFIHCDGAFQKEEVFSYSDDVRYDIINHLPEKKKPEAVTATKVSKIHGASNVMFVYVLQKSETATRHIIPSRSSE